MQHAYGYTRVSPSRGDPCGLDTAKTTRVTTREILRLRYAELRGGPVSVERTV